MEDTLNSTRRQLDALSRRLADLQLLAQQNLRDLEAARNATREAEAESISVRNVSEIWGGKGGGEREETQRMIQEGGREEGTG